MPERDRVIGGFSAAGYRGPRWARYLYSAIIANDLATTTKVRAGRQRILRTTSMTLEAPVARSNSVANPAGRWGQLVCGLMCMVMIANLQYGWTLFVNPIEEKYHWVFPPFRSHSASLSPPKPGWCRSKAGLLIVLARVSLLPLVASSCRLPGRSTPLQTSWCSFTLLPRLVASVLVLFTALASAMHSNGFPIGAGLRRA